MSNQPQAKANFFDKNSFFYVGLDLLILINYWYVSKDIFFISLIVNDKRFSPETFNFLLAYIRPTISPHNIFYFNYVSKQLPSCVDFIDHIFDERVIHGTSGLIEIIFLRVLDLDPHSDSNSIITFFVFRQLVP
jgi:hypothetical protein